MAQYHAGIVVLHTGHGGNEVLQIQCRLWHTEQQQFEFSVVHPYTGGIQLHQAAQGGGIAHSAENELPLKALTVGIHRAAVGPQGLKQAATLCLSKAHYLAQELTKIEGVNLVYSGEFFHEFVTTLPKQEEVLAALAKEGILGGLPVKEGVLWCVTEKATKEALDKAVAIVKEVCA